MASLDSVAVEHLAGCPLCEADGGLLVLRRERWRLVRVTDSPEHPAFYRVIWNAHVAEFSQLSPAHRLEMMEVVTQVESALREHLHPTKVNLASLGNVVPHLHWHVVARFAWDSRFPQPIWGPTQRSAPAEHLLSLTSALPGLDRAIASALAG